MLLEADSAPEAAVDPSSAWQMAVFAEIGGPGEVAAAGLMRFGAVADRAHGADRAARAALWEAVPGAPSTTAVAGDALVRMLVRDTLALGAEMEELQSLLAAELGGDEAYRCPPTVPDIGPKTAAALVVGIDISLFLSCDMSQATAGSPRPTASPSPA